MTPPSMKTIVAPAVHKSNRKLNSGGFIKKFNTYKPVNIHAKPSITNTPTFIFVPVDKPEDKSTPPPLLIP